MNTKPDPESFDATLKRDLAAFERLPEETKEHMKGKKLAEQASGPEKARISKRLKGNDTSPRR